MIITSCKPNTAVKKKQTPQGLSAQEILGNPDYPAISYGGYREISREIQPTIAQLKEDMLLLHAMGVRVIRTYNTHLPHATNTLKAISELKEESPSFEMYVMLGAWIDCENAWTDLPPNHDGEDYEANRAEIERAVELANQYPDIVKVIAVGNEAMVKWATSYYVQANIILKWVNHLQTLKKQKRLPKQLWITSSDNFASWGGGSEEYHTEDLEALIKAVDYISIHTYPMHDTHYNPAFWGVTREEQKLEKTEQIDSAMERALQYAQEQYKAVSDYVQSLGVDKPIHIGETGWASNSNEFYGTDGSKACDEYKQYRYYQLIREWTSKNQISCFFFEAFDEQWKDAQNPKGSENHFGLINLKGEAKLALWEMVDEGVFDSLTRDGNPITKSYQGNLEKLIDEVELPLLKPSLVSQ